MVSEALRAGCKYPDAFCLMLYRSEAGEEEWIWNSRDAVTPFCIRLRRGVEARHVEWHRDRYEPRRVPKVGDRIFVNLTRERARVYRRGYVEKYWNDGECPMSSRYESQNAAVESLADADVKSFGNGTTPSLVEVDEWLLNDLLSKRTPYMPRKFA